MNLWGREIVRRVVQHAPTLAELAKVAQLIGASVEVDSGYRLDLEWIEKHGRHELVAHDEYGRDDAQCLANVRCSGCEASHACKLDAGHEGDHAPGHRR
jgi:hypothetical protein